MPKINATMEQQMDALRVDLQKRWPNNRPLLIVCHGHSVPAGYFRTPDVHPFDSYPHLFHRKLNAAFPTSTVSVVVTAIGGEHSESGAARFGRDVLSKRPDLITIDYALNDRAIGLERSRASWERMIVAAKQAGVPILLLTPTLDLGSDLDDASDPLVRHAALVRELAAHHGVGLADSLSAFERAIDRGASPDSLMSQSNHPNRDGHELVATELARWFTGG